MRPKWRRYALGQQRLLPRIAEAMAGRQTDQHPLCWIHVASYGEYAVARPVIARLKEWGWSVMVTVFSPSGYDAMQRRRLSGNGPDYIFYLPLDTRANAQEFVATVRPQVAVFVISEYWPGYLRVLAEWQTPVFTISTLIHNDSYLLKWRGRLLRQSLRAVTTFMVLDEETLESLHRMGFTNAKVTGDPLFDNAIAVARQPYANAVVERFCLGSSDGVFLAGSISDDKDLQLVSTLANAYRKTKFILVPHEISEETLRKMVYHLDGRALLYSECTEETSFKGVQTLIIDYMGDLPRLYRYGRWAYVGGGFTPYLHSVIEPLIYGLPVVFGPCTGRKTTPVQMQRLGIGTVVRSRQDIVRWFNALRDRPDRLVDIAAKARDYVAANAGATMEVARTINSIKD